MTFNLLDIAPIPGTLEWKAWQKRVKQGQKMQKKLKKKAEKAAKKAEKQAQKLKKKAEKEAKKAEKLQKKAEKQLKVQDLSAAPANTVTTVQTRQENNREPQQAAMPTGIILTVCASLILCMASAWLYRRRSAKV